MHRGNWGPVFRETGEWMESEVVVAFVSHSVKSMKLKDAYSLEGKL